MNNLVNCNNLSLPDLVDYVVEVHHAYVKEHLPKILTNILRVVTFHEDRYPFMKKVFILFSQVNTALVHHFEKEEEIVFSRIREIDDNRVLPDNPGYLDGPIHLMEDEHKTAGALMRRIRLLTNNYSVPADANNFFRVAMISLEEFENRLQQFTDFENQILFSRVLSDFHQTRLLPNGNL